MGYVIDHTGEPRQLRPAVTGPVLRWPPNPQGPEYEISFVQVTPACLTNKHAVDNCHHLGKTFARSTQPSRAARQAPLCRRLRRKVASLNELEVPYLVGQLKPHLASHIVAEIRGQILI